MTKIIQKKNMRPGKRKYTTAKADSSEIAILPMEIASADQADVHHAATGARRSRRTSAEQRRVVVDEVRWEQGEADATSCAVWVDATKVT